MIERGQHTRHSRRWGLAQAEGLRDGYRHSPIVAIKMRALSHAHSSLLWSNCVRQRAAASLCDVGLMMAPKMLRLRSSSQMRDVSTHGAAGDRVCLRPSVCVRAIGTRCRRGINRQGSEVENLARVTPGYVRDADRQTLRSAFTKNRD